MESYCLKCKKNTRNIDPKISSSSNGRAMVLSKCAICGSKKPRFIKNWEEKGLLNNLGTKAPLSEVPILGDILFWMQFHWMCMLNCTYTYKMNEIVNKFLLAGDNLCQDCI